ncbi:MAG: SAM-dependent chlorinase/fluorinase [Actinobacteria bacterium]|nr:SAM-dependent chlorinase/fluorinase [Actinomycetota bacterium]
MRHTWGVSARSPFDHVALLTDYGLDDEFVGVMKSVIADIAPHARITDIGHNVRAYDVRGGSLMLARAIQYVPRGVVVAVVDPGVATKRRMIAVEVAGGEGVLVGPDNGLLVPAAAMVGGVERAVVLSNTGLHLPAPGATFAGRDIFAPVAAHLCNGVTFDELGDIVDADILMPGLVGLPQVGDSEILAEVTWVDVYGNCQLNLGPEDVEILAGASRRLTVVVDGVERSAAMVSAFDDVADGAIGLVIDSYGMLAIAKRQDSAARDVGLANGDQVVLRAPQPGGKGTTTRVSLRKNAPDGPRQ